MSKPLISVITIAHNEEKTIEQTLKSVACQTFGDFEYIIIDGASTDNTVSIARRYCPPVTRILSEKDTGIANAMNKGINLSSGEIIIHLNAGDEFTESNVLEKAASSYCALKWSWAVGSANIIDSVTRKVCQEVKIKGFDYEVLQWMNTAPHQSVFVTKNIFEDYGLFDETFKISMDYEFWLRIGRFVKPHILPFTVSNMRAGGISSEFLKTYFEFCRARNKNNPKRKWQSFISNWWQLVCCSTARLADKYLPRGLYDLLLRQKYRLSSKHKRRLGLKNSIIIKKNIS